jgi:hypothetical protein
MLPAFSVGCICFFPKFQLIKSHDVAIDQEMLSSTTDIFLVDYSYYLSSSIRITYCLHPFSSLFLILFGLKVDA